MRNAAGFTLIELVISMVIIAVAMAGVLSVMNTTTVRSADPMIQEQALAIAEGYLEEILVQNYADPDGADAEGTNRAIYDDVNDYLGLPDTAVRDQNGNLPGIDLSAYTVSVAVNAENIGAQTMQRVTVTVRNPAISNVVLEGYRGNY